MYRRGIYEGGAGGGHHHSLTTVKEENTTYLVDRTLIGAAAIRAGLNSHSDRKDRQVSSFPMIDESMIVNDEPLNMKGG